MLARLLGERAREVCSEWLARAQRRPKIHLVIAEEARAQATVRREAHAIARRAVRVRHRRDETDCPHRTCQTTVARGTISLGGSGIELEGADGRNALANLVARHNVLPREHA